MNAIINIQDFVQVKNSQTITTSELIAQAFNKRHDNVLQSIDNLLADIDPAFAAQNFRETETSTQNNLGFTVKNRAYELTKDGFMLLVMGFTGKAALAIKIAYIQAFNKMAEMLSGSLQPKLAQTTVADRTPLRQAVSALVGRCGFDYSAAYHLVHQRFGVGSIEEIAAEDLPEAVEYVHMLTVYGGMCGEVLEKQPAPQGVVLTERQMGHFAAGAYMLDLATRRLADLSEPLKMLGARDKGVSAWTIRDEAEIWIKNCRSALEAVLPQMGDNFYRGSVQESLRMMDALAAR